MKEKSNNSHKWIGAGILTAIAASVCCITPVLAVIAGIGGIASSLSWLEPFRPLFIALTVIVLGFAWYQQLKPQKDIDCECEDEENTSFWKSKKFLVIVTLLIVLLLAFPYYASVFIPNNNAQVMANSEHIQFLDLKIEGMTCVGCETNINNTVSQVPGVIEVNSDYKSGKAVVRFDKSKTVVDSISAAINRTGTYKVLDQKIEGK